MTERLSKEYFSWKNAVIDRDCKNCVCCGYYGTRRYLEAHHIESYSSNESLRLDLNNGITLCRKCHRVFHDNFGYGNNTRDQFNVFLEKRETYGSNRKNVKKKKDDWNNSVCVYFPMAEDRVEIVGRREICEFIGLSTGGGSKPYGWKIVKRWVAKHGMPIDRTDKGSPKINVDQFFEWVKKTFKPYYGDGSLFTPL